MKINLLLLCSLVIFFFSCENQEEFTDSNKDKIVTKNGIDNGPCKSSDCLPNIIVEANTSAGTTFLGWRMSPFMKIACSFQVTYSDGMNSYSLGTTQTDFVIIGSYHKMTVSIKCLNPDCKKCSNTYSYTRREDGSYSVEHLVDCRLHYKIPTIIWTGVSSFKILPPNNPADSANYLFPDRYTYAFTNYEQPTWSEFGSNPGISFKANESIGLPDMGLPRHYSLVLFSSKCPNPGKHYIYCNLPYQNPNAIDFSQFTEVKGH